jgi:hypothetical protein
MFSVIIYMPRQTVDNRAPPCPFHPFSLLTVTFPKLSVIERPLHSAFTNKQKRNCHFPALGRKCCNIGKLILLFVLWNDTWLVSGKTCNVWRWVMQFLPGAGTLQLRSGISVNALYMCCGVPSGDMLRIRADHKNGTFLVVYFTSFSQ